MHQDPQSREAGPGPPRRSPTTGPGPPGSPLAPGPCAGAARRGAPPARPRGEAQRDAAWGPAPLPGSAPYSGGKAAAIRVCAFFLSFFNLPPAPSRPFSSVFPLFLLSFFSPQRACDQARGCRPGAERGAGSGERGAGSGSGERERGRGALPGARRCAGAVAVVPGWRW